MFRLTLGSTTSFSGSIYFSAPVDPDNGILYAPAGRSWLRNMGSSIYNGHQMTVGGNIYIYHEDETGGSTRSQNVNATGPFTWGSTDVIYAAGSYAVEF